MRDYSSLTYYSVEFILVDFISKLISRPVRKYFEQRMLKALEKQFCTKNGLPLTEANICPS
jgi:hypothetical protein